MCDGKSISRDEVRAIDKIAVDRLGIRGIVLMENAGRQVADAAERFLGGAAGKRVAIVAGAGNNGGDGLVAARHLAIRGANTTTFPVSPESKMTGDAGENLKILRALGAEIRQCGAAVIGGEIRQCGAAAPGCASLAGLAEELKKYDLVIDAIGGTGITGVLRGDLAVAVEQVNLAGKGVLAVDIPTGLDCDSGTAQGPVIRAAMTVTMVARKKGFDAPGAADFTGEVIVADIGIPAESDWRISKMNAR